MRTDMLFGPKFCDDPHLKALVGSDYIKWQFEVAYGNEGFEEARLNLLMETLGFRANWDAIKVQNVLAAKLPNIEEVASLMVERECRRYYVTNRVLQNCSKLKYPEPFDLRSLSEMRDGKRQLNFGDQFFRYEKSSNIINVLAGKKDAGSELGMIYSFFKVDLNEKAIFNMAPVLEQTHSDQERNLLNEAVRSQLDHNSPYKMKSSTDKPWNPLPKSPEMILFEKYRGKEDISKKSNKDSLIDLRAVLQKRLAFDLEAKTHFLKLITYVELAPITEVTLQPGQKTPKGTVDNEKFYNTGQVPMTTINVSWNRTISTEPIEVEEHWRHQAYGPDWSMHRWIIVPSFIKKGYNLKAGKLRDEEMENKTQIPSLSKQNQNIRNQKIKLNSDLMKWKKKGKGH